MCEECLKTRQDSCVSDYAAFDNHRKSLRIFSNGQKLLEHLWHKLKLILLDFNGDFGNVDP